MMTYTKGPWRAERNASFSYSINKPALEHSNTFDKLNSLAAAVIAKAEGR